MIKTPRKTLKTLRKTQLPGEYKPYARRRHDKTTYTFILVKEKEKEIERFLQLEFQTNL